MSKVNKTFENYFLLIPSRKKYKTAKVKLNLIPIRSYKRFIITWMLHQIFKFPGKVELAAG